MNRLMEFLKRLTLVKVPETGPEPTPSWYAGVKKWITAATVIIAAIMAVLATINKTIVDVQEIIKVVPQETPEQLKLSGGWIKDPEEVERTRATYGIPNFSDTPANRIIQNAEGDVYGWEIAKKALGQYIPGRNQGSVGSCVSFGTANAIEYLIAGKIVHDRKAGGPAGEWKPLVQEAIYGGSRVEIGGGRIQGDGSIGAWAAQFVQQYGVLPRDKYEGEDLTVYSESLCRKWGREGVPAKYETISKQSPVKGAALVKTYAEAEKAIQQGYFIAVCSDQGFRMQRDSEGFCQPSGQWMHCMAFVGAKKGDRPGFFIVNSWGDNSTTGPRVPADAPACGWWVDRSVCERMLRQGDSWAFSDAVGFPAKELDLFIRVPIRNLWNVEAFALLK
jgi:hypothetical protein